MVTGNAERFAGAHVVDLHLLVALEPYPDHGAAQP